jgi:hypothetical protein
MPFSGHAVVICSSYDIVFDLLHVLHVMSNLSLIFDKSSCCLGLDLGYSFEQQLMSAVVQVDF